MQNCWRIEELITFFVMANKIFTPLMMVERNQNGDEQNGYFRMQSRISTSITEGNSAQSESDAVTSYQNPNPLSKINENIFKSFYSERASHSYLSHVVN